MYSVISYHILKVDVLEIMFKSMSVILCVATKIAQCLPGISVRQELCLCISLFHKNLPQ